jgi:nucleoside-diphosphate-sugar epimerase
MTSRVLVTGVAGRLGRAVVRELAARGIAATGIAREEDLARVSDLPTVGDLPGAPVNTGASFNTGGSFNTGSESNAGSETVDLAEAGGAGAPTGAGGSGSAAGFRVVAGDVRDPAAVGLALDGVDAVIHLAAIPNPVRDPALTVFASNTAATFTVLDAAAQAGIRRAAIASSLSVTGLPFSPILLAPAYVPVDEDLPLQIADPYALSKQVDEASAQMMWRRHGMSLIALRFPYLGDPDSDLPARVAELTADPAAGVRDMWSYLDYRDAARVCVDAVTVDHTGYAVVGLAAPETLCPYPTEALLDRFLPHVPRLARFEGRAVPIDVSRARSVLGFSPIHPWPLAETPLPPAAERTP